MRPTSHCALGLTPREGEVLRLIAQAKSNKAIAREIGASEGTVKVHAGNVFQKLGVKTRDEAIIQIANRAGIRLHEQLDELRHGR